MNSWRWHLPRMVILTIGFSIAVGLMYWSASMQNARVAAYTKKVDEFVALCEKDGGHAEYGRWNGPITCYAGKRGAVLGIFP